MLCGVKGPPPPCFQHMNISDIRVIKGFETLTGVKWWADFSASSAYNSLTSSFAVETPSIKHTVLYVVSRRSQISGSSVAGCLSLVPIRCSVGWCRAFAGTASRGEEEGGCNSVQSELLGQERSPHCPEISGHPVKNTSCNSPIISQHRVD